MVSCLLDTALVHVLGPSASVDEAPMASFSACAVCWTVAIMKNEASQSLIVPITQIDMSKQAICISTTSDCSLHQKWNLERKYHFILFWLELNLEYWCDEWSIITFNILFGHWRKSIWHKYQLQSSLGARQKNIIFF